MTEFKTKMVSGWHWPADDDHACMVVPQEVRRLPHYLKFVPPHRRRVCIQAGGNVGVYALALAEHFENVVTFEPDQNNWACMVLNIPADHPKIATRRLALSDRNDLIETYRPPGEEKNGGAVMVRKATAAAAISSVIFDCTRWSNQPIDFVMLDVEGHELPALRGMSETLKVCRPTVSVELKGLGQEYGGDDEVRKFLSNLGYLEVAAVGRDVIFTHPGG